MGLRIIYGKSGTGKSEYIYKEINERIKNNEDNKIYIITPEQFSFTAEKNLMKGKKSIINAEVLTFKRMAYRVLSEVGGVINKNLSKCGKAMLIYSILQSQKKNLIYLNKNDENIDLSLRTITELKKHGISIEDLENEILNVKDYNLKIKLNDMILIYKKFEEKINNKYLDDTDLLANLEEKIEKSTIFNNSIIYIDEFSGFTKQELNIINKLLKLCELVTITFVIDDVNLNSNPNTDIFYPNKLTLSKILNLIEKNEKIELINLNVPYRFKNNELIFMENNLYNKKINIYKNKIKNINLFLAKNYYSEIEHVAKKIMYLVKNNNYRFNECAIITKNINQYSSLIKAIFSKYDIPVFIDENKDVNQNAIIKYFLSIFEVLNKNYSYESMFNYLKSGFVDIEEDEIFELENYCIKYDIKNNKWNNDFIYGINEKNKEKIEQLNILRKKIITPFNELKKKIIQEKNAKNIARQIYLFLIEQKIDERILCEINKLKSENNFELASEYNETLKIIIDILDQIVLIFDKDEMSIDKFYKIIKIGFKNSSFGKIPATQDVVIVGDINRSKTHSVKASFIIGINDGVFPSVNKNEGFFNDTDRDFLKGEGIELAKGTLENLYDENLNIYKAFTVSEENIFLSYVSSDNDGKSLRPSMLITKIKKIFPNLIEKNDILDNNEDSKKEIISEKQLYENLINKISNLNEKEFIKNKWNNILKYYYDRIEYKNKLIDNLNYINYSFLPDKIKLENIQKLYGKKIITSVSKLEKYRSCPFSYFLQYELRLKEKEEFKIQSLDTGSFMHDVIDKFFYNLNLDNKKINEIEDEYIEMIINKIIDEKLQNNKTYIFNAKEKYKLLVERLKRIIIKSLKYIINTLKYSEFEVLGTEVEFGDGKKYEPIKFKLKDGTDLEIIGKIDRIDIAKDENNNYVRIIDYKSSVKNIDFSNIYGGLQLQLITYLDAVCKLEDFIPAGVLYFNLLEQMIKSNKKLTEEEIEEKIRNNFKMKGLILADVKVAKMHDKTLDNSSYSRIIPAYIDKEGTLAPKKSSIATREQFELLQNYINKTIKEIAVEILSGNIELKPYYKNKKTPCEFCAYKNMCGFNSGICKNKYRFIQNYSKDEIFEKIKNE